MKRKASSIAAVSDSSWSIRCIGSSSTKQNNINQQQLMVTYLWSNASQIGAFIGGWVKLRLYYGSRGKRTNSSWSIGSNSTKENNINQQQPMLTYLWNNVSQIGAFIGGWVKLRLYYGSRGQRRTSSWSIGCIGSSSSKENNINQ